MQLYSTFKHESNKLIVLNCFFNKENITNASCKAILHVDTGSSKSKTGKFECLV